MECAYIGVTDIARMSSVYAAKRRLFKIGKRFAAISFFKIDLDTFLLKRQRTPPALFIVPVLSFYIRGF